ncbi:MAG: response regulator transcription factor [Hyphomonadaceae bacterium]|nr:response regulator transcription factor [Hyphomonadaceae bacterium]
MPGAVVLVAEDDDILRAFVVQALLANGYAVREAPDGPTALDLALSAPADVLVLDRNLPGLDGLEVLRALRGRGVRTPAMFLTAISGLEERVRGLDSGADDYLAKPFEIEELLARVRALARRSPVLAPELITFGPLRLDMTTWRAFFNDKELLLTAQDMTLLAHFLRRPGQVFTREVLLSQMGAGEDITPAAVEHALSRLRKKLEAAGAVDVIETVRGVGYRLSRSLTEAPQ